MAGPGKSNAELRRAAVTRENGAGIAAPEFVADVFDAVTGEERDIIETAAGDYPEEAVNIMNRKQHATFEEKSEVDLAYGTEDGYRYRVNVFRQRGTTGMVMRIIPSQIPAFERLNLPKRVHDLLAFGVRGRVR